MSTAETMPSSSSASTARCARRSATAAGSISTAGCPSSSSTAARATSGSLARRVAVNSPAYLVWAPDDDALALPLLDQLAAAIEQRLGAAPLIFILSDQPVPLVSGKAPRLPQFVAEIAAARRSRDAARRRPRWRRPSSGIRADLRHCKVERVAHGDRGQLPADAHAIGLQLPSIHCQRRRRRLSAARA